MKLSFLHVRSCLMMLKSCDIRNIRSQNYKYYFLNYEIIACLITNNNKDNNKICFF